MILLAVELFAGVPIIVVPTVKLLEHEVVSITDA
jgi:hypothetical protein